MIDGGEDELSTAQAAASIELKSEKTELCADGLDTAQVEITLLDKKGIPALDEVVHCQIVGDMQLLGIENGRPDDLTPYAEPFRTTLDGRAIAYLRAGCVSGSATLHVWTASGLSATCVFDQKVP